MGTVYLDATEIGTFEPQTSGTSGFVRLNTTIIGTFTLAASGNVLLNATIIGTYTASTTEDFSISAVPDVLIIPLNSYDHSLITVTSINAFNSAVTLSVLGAPTGVSTDFSDNPITPPADGEATSTLTITVNTAIIGEYTLTVKGVSGALEHTDEILLRIIKVTPPPIGDDPKTILMTQLQANITVFKDDEITPATVYVVFNIPPETIRELLKTQYDAVVTIGDPERDEVIRRATVDFHETSLYPVRGYCIDKTGITAKTLMWRLVREIWRVINASASSPGGQVRHWSISEGQAAEDVVLFKQLLLCRRVRVKLFFVEAG